MAKHIEKLEEKFQRLRDQHVDAAGSLASTAKAHGLAMQDYFIMPAMDSVLESISKIDAVGGEVPPELEEFRRMADDRKKKLESLPADVRVAIARFSEIEGLLSNVQLRLVRELFLSGKGVAVIAKRLATSEGLIRGVLEIPDE